MDIFEELALAYLTKNGHTFVSPQYRIGDWSCPDFVALDFQAKRVSIVEVSAAYNIHDLARKVANSERQWFEKLRPRLQHGAIVPKDWTYGVEVFIRKNRREEFAKKISGTAGVEVTPLENLTVPWEWNWETEKSE